MALYPPIIASSLPAFNLNQNILPLEFSLSKYNSKSEIRTIQVTVRRHTSNVNVVENDIYNCAFVEDDSKKIVYNERTNTYTLNIPINGSNAIRLNANVLYRVQMRFCDLLINDVEGSSMYTNKPSHFSEWSTVCIIKPITAPSFYLKDLDNSEDEGTDITTEEFTLDYSTADFVGVYDYKNSSLILYKWRLRLLNPEYNDKDQYMNILDYTIIDSGWTFVGSYNYNTLSSAITINCNLNYEFPDKNSLYGFNGKYKLLFEIETRNEYTDSKLYLFNLSDNDDLERIPLGKLQVAVNEELGYIKVKYSSPGLTVKMANWVLRRTSSTSNFLNWEDIWYFDVPISNDNTLQAFEKIYIDYTPLSGVIYKYGVQMVNIYGKRGPLVVSQLCMGEWLHAFLLLGCDSNARQLKLKYDFDISSYKTNVSESKTDTIGSRYPFVRRNGNMYYKSFPVTGIITALMDDEELFTNNTELYGTSKIVSQHTDRTNQSNEDIYEEFFGLYDNYVNRYNYTHERKFRERVEEFLYNSNVKLYKSMQEGNILVKLMEVSLTPKKELGRLIYTFSATAYLIANVHLIYWHANIRGAAANNPSNLGAGVFSDSNINIIKTLNDYGFFNIGTYKTDINYTDKDWRIGQISCYGGYNENTRLPIIANTNLTDISKAIINKYWGNVKNLETGILIEDMDLNDNIYISDMLIKDIHIEIDNAPYLVDGANGISNGTFYEKDQTKNIYELGTVINFNGGKSILVAPPHRIYNIMEDRIYSIKDTTFEILNFIGTVDFLYKLKYSIDRTKLSYKTTSKNVAGYLDYDDIKLNGNMINLIHMKYSQNYLTESDIVNSRITGINNIIIDSDPGTVIDITTKDNPVGADPVITRLVVNETGILKLNTILLNSFITSLQIKGVLEKGILNPNKKPDILLYYFITTKTEYTKRNV